MQLFDVDLQLINVLFIWNMHCWVVYAHHSNFYVIFFKALKNKVILAISAHFIRKVEFKISCLMAPWSIADPPLEHKKREESVNEYYSSGWWEYICV